MTTTIVTANRSGIKAIDFSADNETWIIEPGVFIRSSSIGANSIYNNNRLINKGHIWSKDYGVWFYGDSLVTNKASGTIAGHNFGILLEQSTNKSAVVNHGTITSPGIGVEFGVNAHGASLNNTGHIVGRSAGVFEFSSYTGGVITNSGLISSGPSPSVGIQMATDATLTTVINNTATGIIKGTVDAIYAGDGMLTLHNFGKLIGGIHDGNDLHDVVINHGIIQGRVELQGGNDVFIGTGGKSGPVFGGGGNDHLVGGSHNDPLHGGNGNDTLTGGPGADKFFFDTNLNATTNVDTITDFTPAQHDKIVLSETYFAGLGPLGTLAAGSFHVGSTVPPNPHIIYTPGNGFLYYDADGTLRGTTHFATLTSHPTLHATDFILVA